MTERTAKPQTVASRKYQQKVGLIAKSFKLRKELADRFAMACEKAGVSQAAQISKMMEDFIEQVSKDN